VRKWKEKKGESESGGAGKVTSGEGTARRSPQRRRSPTGSRSGEPSRPPEEMIRGEGTSGRSSAQGRSPMSSHLGDSNGPGAERGASSSGSKRPGHRKEGGCHRYPSVVIRFHGGNQ
jgi:hypothetical protein